MGVTDAKSTATVAAGPLWDDRSFFCHSGKHLASLPCVLSRFDDAPLERGFVSIQTNLSVPVVVVQLRARAMHAAELLDPVALAT